MVLTDRAHAAIKAHAMQCYPNESCGLIVDDDYVPCTNVAAQPADHFAISAVEYARAEDRGAVQAIVHSHPDASSLPSIDDMRACEASGVPVWLIQGLLRSSDGNIQVDHLHQFSVRAGSEAPLIGARFIHGSQDCYGLVRRYYWAAFDVALPDFERCGRWWEDGRRSLYLDNYETAGFVSVGLDADWHTGDVLLMAIASRHGIPNHAAVYLGGDEILHHLWDQLSRREPLPRYRKYVTHVLRHRETLKWKI